MGRGNGRHEGQRSSRGVDGCGRGRDEGRGGDPRGRRLPVGFFVIWGFRAEGGGPRIVGGGTRTHRETARRRGGWCRRCERSLGRRSCWECTPGGARGRRPRPSARRSRESRRVRPRAARLLVLVLRRRLASPVEIITYLHRIVDPRSLRKIMLQVLRERPYLLMNHIARISSACAQLRNRGASTCSFRITATNSSSNIAHRGPQPSET